MKLFLNSFQVTLIFLKTIGYFLIQHLIGIVYWGFDKKNWKTVKMYFTMAQELSKFAKREKIAKNVGWLAKKFDDITKNYSHEDIQKAANKITSSKGLLEDLKIGYKQGEVTGNLGPLEAKYDPTNGSVKFGLRL